MIKVSILKDNLIQTLTKDFSKFLISIKTYKDYIISKKEELSEDIDSLLNDISEYEYLLIEKNNNIKHFKKDINQQSIKKIIEPIRNINNPSNEMLDILNILDSIVYNTNSDFHSDQSIAKENNITLSDCSIPDSMFSKSLNIIKMKDANKAKLESIDKALYQSINIIEHIFKLTIKNRILEKLYNNNIAKHQKINEIKNQIEELTRKLLVFEEIQASYSNKLKNIIDNIKNNNENDFLTEDKSIDLIKELNLCSRYKTSVVANINNTSHFIKIQLKDKYLDYNFFLDSFINKENVVYSSNTNIQESINKYNLIIRKFNYLNNYEIQHYNFNILSSYSYINLTSSADAKSIPIYNTIDTDYNNKSKAKHVLSKATTRYSSYYSGEVI